MTAGAAAGTAAARYRRRSLRRTAFVACAFAAMAATLLLDVLVGPGNLPAREVLATLIDPAAALVRLNVIVWDVRLPVAVMAVLVGAMLGVAGAQMQTILNNPLADPFTLGISAAASFGASLTIVTGLSVLPVAGPIMITVNAFLFALSTSIVLFAITRMRGVTIETFILVGIALFFIFNALLTLIQYTASETQLQQIVFWMMGSLSRATWGRIGVCAALLAVAIPFCMSRNWWLSALTMGDDRAASLGVPVARLRLEMLAVVSLLAATAVAFVGTIGFVGLVGPHIARMLVGEDQRYFLPVSAAAGAILLSIASTVSKAVVPGVIYPIGMVTALVGVPFFLSLVLSIRKGGWR